MRAAGMVDRPEAMMRPGFVLRVLWKSLGRAAASNGAARQVTDRTPAPAG